MHRDGDPLDNVREALAAKGERPALSGEVLSWAAIVELGERLEALNRKMAETERVVTVRQRVAVTDSQIAEALERIVSRGRNIFAPGRLT